MAKDILKVTDFLFLHVEVCLDSIFVHLLTSHQSFILNMQVVIVLSKVVNLLLVFLVPGYILLEFLTVLVQLCVHLIVCFEEISSSNNGRVVLEVAATSWSFLLVGLAPAVATLVVTPMMPLRWWEVINVSCIDSVVASILIECSLRDALWHALRSLVDGQSLCWADCYPCDPLLLWNVADQLRRKLAEIVRCYRNRILMQRLTSVSLYVWLRELVGVICWGNVVVMPEGSRIRDVLFKLLIF